MSFDIAFYDAVVDMKKAVAAAQGGDNGGAEHASAGEDVFTLLGDWQEDTLDIQAFLQARSVDAAVPAPALPAAAAPGGGGVGRLPTPVIVRPNNLNLTQGLYSGAQAAGSAAHHQQQQHVPASSRGGQVSPHGGGGAVHQVPEMPQVSPQHSPYGQSATMFDYSGLPAVSTKQHRAAAAAAAMMASAQSPHTPVFGSYSAAVSAAAQTPSMHGGSGGCLQAVVKHDEDSCSSSLDSYQAAGGLHSGASSSASRKRTAAASVSSTERDPDAYRAKRERNNVAVRKSREKKKQREQETEKRVKELSDENSSLVGKVELLTKQLATIKSLFAVLTKSLPPEHRRRAELELDSLNVGRFYEPPTTPPPQRGGGVN